MDSQNFNGWKNRETWLAALWFNNEEGRYRYWREQAQECWEKAPEAYDVRKGLVSAKEEAVWKLAMLMMGEIEEGAAKITDGLFVDLFNAALWEVDWFEVAEDFLEEFGNVKEAGEKTNGGDVLEETNDSTNNG